MSLADGHSPGGSRNTLVSPPVTFHERLSVQTRSAFP